MCNLKYDNYLFDLDGTLTDPGVGIKNSIRHALDKFGIQCPEDNVLNSFIGPPLISSFRKYFAVSENDAKTLLTYYREYYSVIGYLENDVYPCVADTLGKIHDSGRKTMLATSKPDVYAIKILEHFDLLKYFDFCAGNDLSESRPTKDAVIAYLLESTGIDPSRTVMVGDRCYDIDGAKKHSLTSVGVLFGYGSKEELKDADYLIEKFEDILCI